MKLFLLIYNPVAGDSRFRHRLGQLAGHMRERDCYILPFPTSAETGVQGISELMARSRFDGVLIAGGDGTIHEVLQLAVKQHWELPLGLIPWGTSNDFAHHIGMTRELEACAQLFAGDSHMLVDVGCANGEYFLNVASAGLLTSVAHTADRTLKNTLGKVAYFLKGFEELPRFRAVPMRIWADDRKIEDDIMLFVVLNSSCAGSFAQVAPKARIDDGLLDMLIVHSCRLPELAGILLAIFSGSHLRHRAVEYLQATDIRIETGEDLESDLDGEQGPSLPLHITLLPRVLRLYVPVTFAQFSEGERENKFIRMKEADG